jgi:hypothetical protein
VNFSLRHLSIPFGEVGGMPILSWALASPTVVQWGHPMKVVHQLVAYFMDRGELTARQIKYLAEQGHWAPQAPPNLQALTHEIGARYYFQITGEVQGPLWGTDVYTSDSSIGKAAVHAGLVQPGEARVLQLTIESPLNHYRGSHRNGVTSDSWDAWPGAFSLAPVS